MTPIPWATIAAIAPPPTDPSLTLPTTTISKASAHLEARITGNQEPATADLPDLAAIVATAATLTGQLGLATDKSTVTILGDLHADAHRDQNPNTLLAATYLQAHLADDPPTTAALHGVATTDQITAAITDLTITVIQSLATAKSTTASEVLRRYALVADATMSIAAPAPRTSTPEPITEPIMATEMPSIVITDPPALQAARYLVATLDADTSALDAIRAVATPADLTTGMTALAISIAMADSDTAMNSTEQIKVAAERAGAVQVAHGAGVVLADLAGGERPVTERSPRWVLDATAMVTVAIAERVGARAGVSGAVLLAEIAESGLDLIAA